MILYKKSKILPIIERSNDNRGSILSIVDHQVLNVSIIESQKNTIRSNHYHKKDFHFMYVLEGEIDYFYKSLKNEKVKYLKVSQGNTIFTPNLEIHATYFPVNTKLVVSSGFARDKKTYEEDTVRIEFINDGNLDFYIKSYAKK